MKSAVSRPIKISLRLIGVWPDSSYRIPKCVLWTSCLVSFITFQYWYCISHFNTIALVDLLDNMSIAMSNTLVFIKIVIIWLKNRVFRETLTMMNEDWNDRATNESETMIERAVLSYRITKFLMIIFSSTVTFYYLAVYFILERNNNGRIFLIKMEFPFDPTVSPIYEIIFAVHIVGEMTIALMAGILMALIATVVIHVTGQIDLVTERLKEVLSTENEKQSRMTDIKSAIAKHQRIISFSEKIESVFTFMAFSQFFFDIIVICFIGFTLVTSLNTGKALKVLFKTLPYYATVNFQALLLCYSAEYLASKGENIGWVVYNCSWEELNVVEIRMLLLLILRTQKPLKLTIGKFMDLSLVTFANMLKVSASYVSVLYAME